MKSYAKVAFIFLLLVCAGCQPRQQKTKTKTLDTNTASSVSPEKKENLGTAPSIERSVEEKYAEFKIRPKGSNVFWIAQQHGEEFSAALAILLQTNPDLELGNYFPHLTSKNRDALLVTEGYMVILKKIEIKTEPKKESASRSDFKSKPQPKSQKKSK